uniref:RNA-dependent RNA polymerase n=1 Tax=Subalpine fir deltapartitivirus TaxID=2933091 RepID=A0A9C7GWQ3_9VIRU|nr:RNA-dependent RNA polymerase [Subalpine fir deltapartitivirus]CAI5383990.1 RNA-dependent RNA polymerase [Subalpine fir deltapartitivirus]
MDHQFRKERRGLIELGVIPERLIRDECEILVDPYAEEAIDRLASVDIKRELAGWARSYYTLDGHLEAIMKYDRLKIPEPTEQAWNRTKQYVLTEFRRMPTVEVLSYKDFDKVKYLRSSSAGYGYIGLKGAPGNYERAKRTAVTIAESLNHDPAYGPEAIANSTPDIAFTRTQLSQIKVKRKVRNVWGEAFHYVLLEGLFADPLIKSFMERHTFYFIGKDPLLAVPALIQEILSYTDYVYQLDWQAFDSSVQEWEIRHAFHLLEQLLVYPSKVEKQIWHFVIELFIYRKIACPDRRLRLKTLGIPSGSCFTNIVGSIVNYTRIQFLFMKLTREPSVAYTHGDDSLAGVSATQYIPLSVLSESCTPYDWQLKLEKSLISSEAEQTTFLSRTVREGQNFRDTLTCLRMLKYPEYPVPTGDISTLRAFSIAKDSGLSSTLLTKIFQYLQCKHGMAQTLPLNLQRWDPFEYELLRQSFSTTL